MLNLAKSPFQLHNETRFLVHQGLVYGVSLKKLHYYLFNDILFITKAQGDKQKMLYNVDLLHASMDAKPEAIYELSFGNEKLSFRIDKGLDNLEVWRDLCKVKKVFTLQ